MGFLVLELVEQFEAISQSTLHIVDKGHYEFPLNGHSYDDAYQLPSVNVGEIGKLSFNADDATWGGLAVPSSGLYFVVASVEDFHNWDGGSDGSYIVTSNYSISFANWNKSGTFFKSVGKTRDDYYKGSGYVFYMRLL